MKIQKEEFVKITEKYLDGIKAIEIAKEYNVAHSTINLIIKKELGAQRHRLTKEQKNAIKNEYQQGKKIKEISEEFNCAVGTIANALEKLGIRPKSENGKHKGGFTELQKEEIIDLYVNQQRGKSYIGSLFGVSDCSISYWLKKWEIETIPRTEISKKIREVYGPTAGFSGRKHTDISKEKITDSSKKAWLNLNRQPTIGHSRTYDTIIGKVLGKFEVAYVQMCCELGETLPEVCRKRYHTPFGTYKPDFIKNSKFIEIKSEFTLRVAQGQYHDNHGKYSDNQWKKICYFSEYIHDLDVVILDHNHAERLFKRACILR